MPDPTRLASPGSRLTSTEDEHVIGRAVRDMFAAVAPRYDLLNRLLSFGRDFAWRKATARALQEILARPGSVAVDLCCGTGDLTLALASVSSGKVIGADFCHPMLQRARRKSPPQLSSVFYLEADTLVLPFRQGSLDVVAIAFGFRNLANYAQGLREMHRVLKPGGLLAILEFSRVRWPVFATLFHVYFRHILPRLGTWISGVRGPYQYLRDSVSRFPNQESLAEAMRDAGFTKVRHTNFTGGVAALHLGEKV